MGCARSSAANNVEAPAAGTRSSEPVADKSDIRLLQGNADSDDCSTAIETEVSSEAAPAGEELVNLDHEQQLDVDSKIIIAEEKLVAAFGQSDIVEIEEEENYAVRARGAGRCGFCDAHAQYGWCWGVATDDTEYDLKSRRPGWYFPIGGGHRDADVPDVVEHTTDEQKSKCDGLDGNPAGANGTFDVEVKARRPGWYFPIGGGHRDADVSEVMEHTAAEPNSKCDGSTGAPTGADGTSDVEVKSRRPGWYFPIGGGHRDADIPEVIEHTTEEHNSNCSNGIRAGADGTSDVEVKSRRPGWYFPIGGGHRDADVPEVMVQTTDEQNVNCDGLDSNPPGANGTCDVEVKSRRPGWYFPIGGGHRDADVPEVMDHTVEEPNPNCDGSTGAPAGADGTSDVEIKSRRPGWYFPIGGGHRDADVPEVMEHTAEDHNPNSDGSIGAPAGADATGNVKAKSRRPGWYFPIGGGHRDADVPEVMEHTADYHNPNCDGLAGAPSGADGKSDVKVKSSSRLVFPYRWWPQRCRCS